MPCWRTARSRIRTRPGTRGPDPAAAPDPRARQAICETAISRLDAAYQKLFASNGAQQPRRPRPSRRPARTSIESAQERRHDIPADEGVVGARWPPCTACAVLAACGSSDPASGSAGSSARRYDADAVQRPARPDGAEPDRGVREEDRDQGPVRNDDEDALADQIATEGSELARRRVLHRELAAAGEPAGQGPARRRSTRSRCSTRRRRYNSAQGDWVGVSGRVSVLVYNPSLISASQLPKKVSELARPRYKGKLALAPQETDFQPIVTAYNQAYGKAATLKWLAGVKANAAGHVYPDNETVAAEVNKGAIAFGLINQYYWCRMRAEIGTAKMHSRLALLRAARPRLRRRRLRGGRPEVEQAPGSRRRSSWPSWSARRARRSSPTRAPGRTSRSASSTRSPRG